MAREHFIKVRVSATEREHYRRVSEAVNRDLSDILRKAVENLGKRHGIKPDVPVAFLNEGETP